jgi:hypothetical protein
VVIIIPHPRGLCHHKNFFSGWESCGSSSNSHPRREKATIIVIPNSLFIIHHSYIVTTLLYWPTGAFLQLQLQLQLPLPLPPPLATAATTFKRRFPSQIIQEPRSFPPPPIWLPQTKASHPCDSKDPTDRWLSAHPHPHPHPPAEF